MTQIIVAVFGGLAGIITAVTTLVFKILEYKRKSKEDSLECIIKRCLEPLEERLDKLEAEKQIDHKELHEIRLDTTRTQLYVKTEHDSHNHDTILKIAHRYFCELSGDWVATVDFCKWADDEGVKIPQPILEAIARNEKKQSSV